MNTDHLDYTSRRYTMTPVFGATIWDGTAWDKFREWGATEVELVHKGLGLDHYMLQDDVHPGWFYGQVSTSVPQHCSVPYPPKHRYLTATAAEAWSWFTREQDEEKGREHVRWLVYTLGKTWVQAELDKLDG